MPSSNVHEGHRVRRRVRSSASLCVVLAMLSASACACAFADDAQQCSANAGTLLVGQVVSPPTFKHGMFRKGVELSHTHLTLKSNANGQNYDVAIDNVFASGYQQGSPVVPPPLNSIAVGDRLELCGIPYQGGMHWVHTNCGDTPTAQDPNGWLKVIAASGTAGPSFEDSQQYCYLWPRN